ncbi:MAG: hypothetical protein AAF604_02085 [Acidobacteriota bacterium]
MFETLEENLSTLRFPAPRRIGDCEVFEAVDDSSPDPDEHIYSCVALCRRNWGGGWPALGGTRLYQGAQRASHGARQQAALHEAVELAEAMYLKNSLLRRAEECLPPDETEARGLFGWQGGKGVVWTPHKPELTAAANRRRFLTPRRLLCHGLLLQRLAGEYIGSKDMGVGSRELKWMEFATRFTIGNGCLRDTGEATAAGVVAGLRQAVIELRALGELAAGPGGRKQPLGALPILVIGAGKVGLPLLADLDLNEGAEVWIYDWAFEKGDLRDRIEVLVSKAAEDVRDTYRQVLRRLHAAGRILTSEADALALSNVAVLSPNGGSTGWLSSAPKGGEEKRSRARILADGVAAGGKLRLVLGAGNDQVPISDAGETARRAALDDLTSERIWFVPDPLVSPGGVIAVSHELAPQWKPEAVDADARSIVTVGVQEIFRRYGVLEGEEKGSTDALWRCFLDMVESPWSLASEGF